MEVVSPMSSLDVMNKGNLSNMDVLVTDGDQRATVAVVRSLGRKGLRVVVGEQRDKSLAGCSRFCSGRFTYPSPASDPIGFQRTLLEHIKTNRYKLLIPMTDLVCTLVAEIVEQLRPLLSVGMPEGGAYFHASDKGELLKLAQSHDIPVPATLFPNDISQLEALTADLDYPVVIKARRSRLQVGSIMAHGRVEYAHSREELIAKFARSHANIPSPIVQERIKGPGCGLFALCVRGEPLALFAHRRLREKPPSGGVSVLRESAPLDDSLCTYSRKLLKALNWTGVAMVEFKMDERDNTPKLMEINGRFWGSLQLAIDSGMDFPHWLYQISQGETPSCPDSYRVGVRTRWFLGDVDHLLSIWLHRRKMLSLPRDYPGRIPVLWDFIKETWSSSKNEMWDTDDLGPARREVIDYLFSAIKQLRRRL